MLPRRVFSKTDNPDIAPLGANNRKKINHIKNGYRGQITLEDVRNVRIRFIYFCLLALVGQCPECPPVSGRAWSGAL